MLETVLLGLKVLFLLLLYLFIFRMVRTLVRDLKGAPEPAPAAAPPPSLHPAPLRGRRRPVPAEDPAETEVGNTSEFDFLTAKIKPRLVVQHSKILEDGKVFRLKGGATVGRSPGSDIVLEDDYVSATHARIFARRQFLYLEDLGSTNGTFVDGRRVNGETQIKPGQDIVVGDTVFRYEE